MILQVIYSIILGFLIGLERESSGKEIGIRTASLISLGSTLFCLISSTITQGDPTRIVGQVITGVGFIGAGLIFRSDNHMVYSCSRCFSWNGVISSSIYRHGINYCY